MLELIRESLDSPVTLLYALVLSTAAAGLIVEIAVSLISGRKLFSARDSLANVVLYVGYVATGLVWVHVVFRIYVAVSDFALVELTVGGWHIGNNGLWWEWLLLFVLEDVTST